LQKLMPTLLPLPQVPPLPLLPPPLLLILWTVY
jgi:hypothetical protein